MDIFDKILDILFPPVCAFCGKICKENFCTECEKKFSNNFIYGRNLVYNKYFDEHIYIAKYEGAFRQAILDYKFNGKSYFYKTFSKIILKSKKICDILKSCDIIIPIPIHKKRKSNRGYDQSALISKEIAKNIEHLEYLQIVRKIKNNKKQSLLNKEERIENVKNAYEILNCERICNKRIILFDDIYTTGNTVNECSRILKENGAKYIMVLSLTK